MLRPQRRATPAFVVRSEEHTSELQSRFDLVCRLLLEKKNLHCNTRNSSLYQQLIDSCEYCNETTTYSLRVSTTNPRIHNNQVKISLFFSTPPPSRQIYTLSLHDTLPI